MNGFPCDDLTKELSEAKTTHVLYHGDSRRFDYISDNSVHLVLTSPPYWNLKKYNESSGQMGHIDDYELFLDELTKTWEEAYRVLVPGGRLVCVVGDVCLSRRKNKGRHVVVPLHSDICVRCRKIGFDNLNPIIWHKPLTLNWKSVGVLHFSENLMNLMQSLKTILNSS